MGFIESHFSAPFDESLLLFFQTPNICNSKTSDLGSLASTPLGMGAVLPPLRIHGKLAGGKKPSHENN